MEEKDEELLLTGREIADLVREAQTNDYTMMEGIQRIAKAQLLKAKPIIEKLEWESVLTEILTFAKRLPHGRENALIGDLVQYLKVGY